MKGLFIIACAQYLVKAGDANGKQRLYKLGYPSSTVNAGERQGFCGARQLGLLSK
jgi:hypothetical protein